MSIVGRFVSGEFTVTRGSAGTYKDGFYLAGDAQTIKVKGSMQPATAREVKMPEEGGRLRQIWKFYTDQPIGTLGTRSLARADVVTVNGETYKVWSVEEWSGFSMSYFKSILYREPEQ